MRSNFYQENVFLKVAIVISLLIAIFIALSVGSYLEATNLNEEDYNILENRAVELSQKKDITNFKDCKILMDEDTFCVRFEKNNCRVNVEYNYEYEILSMKREATNKLSYSWICAIVLSVAVTFFFVSFAIFCLVDECATFLVLIIKNKIKPQKN